MGKRQYQRYEPTKADRAELARIGENIRALRLGRELASEDLAREAGLDRANLGRIERGQVNPSIITLLRIARALGVELAELVGAHRVSSSTDDLVDAPRVRNAILGELAAKPRGAKAPPAPRGSSR